MINYYKVSLTLYQILTSKLITNNYYREEMSDYCLDIIKTKQVMCYNMTLRHLRATIVAVGNQYSEHVFVD